MNRTDAYQGEPGGPIAYMASNPVAANLLMFSILAAGLVALGALEREAWPTIPFNTIEVSVVYPGATPDEMEESIVVKIEEQVEALADVKAVKSLAAPGLEAQLVELSANGCVGRQVEGIDSGARPDYRQDRRVGQPSPRSGLLDPGDRFRHREVGGEHRFDNLIQHRIGERPPPLLGLVGAGGGTLGKVGGQLRGRLRHRVWSGGSGHQGAAATAATRDKQESPAENARC